MLNVLEPYILCSDYIITMIKQLLKSTALPQHSPQSEEMTDISLMSRFWLFEKTPILNYKHLYFSGYTGTQANVFLLSQLSWVNRLKRPVSKVKNKTFCCFHILSSQSHCFTKIDAILTPATCSEMASLSITVSCIKQSVQNETPNQVLNKTVSLKNAFAMMSRN